MMLRFMFISNYLVYIFNNKLEKEQYVFFVLKIFITFFIIFFWIRIKNIDDDIKKNYIFCVDKTKKPT